MRQYAIRCYDALDGDRDIDILVPGYKSDDPFAVEDLYEKAVGEHGHNYTVELSTVFPGGEHDSLLLHIPGE